MAQFIAANREHFHSMYGRADLHASAPTPLQTKEEVHGYGFVNIYGGEWVRTGGFVKMPTGELISFNNVAKTATVRLEADGKLTERTLTGDAYKKYFLMAELGKEIDPNAAKRMMEDAGRKYKSAAVRVNDKLLYKTWKAPKVDATVEVTPSWLKVTYNRDHTARGVTYKAGKQVVIKNDDPGYRQWADELNAAYMAGQLTLARGATSADDAEKRRTAKAVIHPHLKGKTWNDGKFTYVIKGDGTVQVGKKTYKVGAGAYDTVARNLNVMKDEKKLEEGALSQKATPSDADIKEMKADLQMSETGAKASAAEEEVGPSSSAASAGGKDESLEIRDGKGKGGGLTDSPYFLPAVGVGVLALGLGGYFLLRKKG
jgi:hypothetical protein